jgi:acylphosphatase
MSETATIHRHVVIHGRVQGVGYRAWVEHEALVRGLEGFVRNRRDGTVEALFVGSADIVAAMVEACHHGPPTSEVVKVEENAVGSDALSARRRAERFSVLPTA